MSENNRADRIPFYVAGGFTLVVLILLSLKAIDPIDHKWLNQLFRWRGMEPADSRITLVAIDDQSIKQVGQYPWPRGVYSKLFDRLFGAGVKVVGLDIIFPDPSPSRQDDQALVEATRKWGARVVHSVDYDPAAAAQHEWAFRFPFPALKAVAKSLGVVNQTNVDGDGVIRRTMLVYGTSSNGRLWKTDPKRQYSLGLRTLSVYEGRDPDDYLQDRINLMLNVRGEEQRKVTRVEGDRQNVVEETVYGVPRVSAADVLAGRLSDAQKKALNGGIVLVGSTARAAFDHFPSAFTDASPGVEVHANVIDNLLNGRELHSTVRGVALLIAIVFAFFSAWASSLTPMASTILVLSTLAAWIGGNVYAFRHYWAMQFTGPTLALMGPFLVLTIRRTLNEYQEKRFIKQTFGQFVAPEVVEDLIRDPSKIKLGGQKREMSMLFMDIEQFTKISEQMNPEDLIWALNRYLTRMSQVIQKNKGMVDKYVGDCIVAIWNAPLEQKDHRKFACLAAIECQEILAEINQELKGRVPRPFAARIGLNTGLVTVGLMGSEQKLEYTVIGDDMNAASRLEGANKFFSSRIMVADSCYQGAKDEVEARRLGAITVVGKSVPVRVYELLAKKGSLRDGWSKALPIYEKGIDLFEKGVELAHKKKKTAEAKKAFASAKEAFAEVLQLVPNDGPSKIYLSEAEGKAILPNPDWDGVFNLKEK